MKVPICKPILIGNEWKYVKDCLDTGWISGRGKYIEMFEDKFSKYLGVKYGVACTNGTIALHLALEAASIKSGDEVIIPSFTIVSVANAVLWSGAKPVVAAVEEDTGNIDVKKIEEKITKKTKAIIPVHIYGHPCEMDKIMALAKKYKLLVIEDAAEAHGAEYKGRKTGSMGDVGCFSFFSNKIITTGEGGMVVTNNKEIAERAKWLRDLAFGSSDKFKHEEIGFNYRMTNISAAIGLAQLENIDKFVMARREHAELYNKLLKDVPEILTPVEKDYAKNVYWMYSIILADSLAMDKKEFIKQLAEKGVQTRDFFYPMHQQPVFKKMGLFKNDKCPVSEKLYQRGLQLPSSSGLTEEEIKYVVEAIKEIIKIK